MEKLFGAGQSLEVLNGATITKVQLGASPAKLIAVYIVEKGKPLVQPAQYLKPSSRDNGTANAAG